MRSQRSYCYNIIKARKEIRVTTVVPTRKENHKKKTNMKITQYLLLEIYE